MDGDYVKVNEDGTFEIYSHMEPLTEAAAMDAKEKKAALKQLKKAVKATFKETKSKLRIAIFVSWIGEMSFVNGSSNSVAVSFTKKGRQAVMLALSGAAGAGLGAASLVVPAAALAAPVVATGLAVKAVAKDEKDTHDFITEHKSELTKNIKEMVIILYGKIKGKKYIIKECLIKIYQLVYPLNII